MVRGGITEKPRSRRRTRHGTGCSGDAERIPRRRVAAKAPAAGWRRTVRTGQEADAAAAGCTGKSANAGSVEQTSVAKAWVENPRWTDQLVIAGTP
jgi:hypothetical protein